MVQTHKTEINFLPPHTLHLPHAKRSIIPAADVATAVRPIRSTTSKPLQHWLGSYFAAVAADADRQANS